MDVPACDDPRVYVTIPVPVKGRKQPLVLRVPRFDFIDEATYDELTAALDAIDTDNPDMVVRKRIRLARLTMLKPFVPDKDYAICETLAVGQLDAIATIWSEQSGIMLGEFVASANSSTASTEAPSNTTSTVEGGPAATSDAA